jgi:Double-GTPase 2
MDEALPVIGMILAVIGYIALVIGFLVFVGPFVAAGAALALLAVAGAEYVRAVHHTVSENALKAAPSGQAGQPAYRQYFFGPALHDLREGARAGLQGVWALTLTWLRGAVHKLFSDDDETLLLVTGPVGVAVVAGLGVGTGAWMVVLTAVAALHALTVLAAQLVARVAIGLLRLVDSAMRLVRGVRSTHCSNCYALIDYPAYACPECRRLHHDIRPGRYGVLRRRCACDRHRMPTLMILGSHKLTAYCAACNEVLPDGTGYHKELLVPLYGGRAAGKTQLMAAMMAQLLGAGRGGPASDRTRPADDPTRSAYTVLGNMLRSADRAEATGPGLPRAHALRLADDRMLLFFDAAGERYLSAEQTGQLTYANAARTALFVLDPLAVPAFRDLLSAAETVRLASAPASEVPPDKVFGILLKSLLDMGVPVDRSRLAVTVSKTDLVGGCAVLADRVEHSDWVHDWLAGPLGLGNLVRTMENHFAEVRFFLHAAVLDQAGRPDPSIAPLVDWILEE